MGIFNKELPSEIQLDSIRAPLQAAGPLGFGKRVLRHSDELQQGNQELGVASEYIGPQGRVVLEPCPAEMAEGATRVWRKKDGKITLDKIPVKRVRILPGRNQNE